MGDPCPKSARESIFAHGNAGNRTLLKILKEYSDLFNDIPTSYVRYLARKLIRDFFDIRILFALRYNKKLLMSWMREFLQMDRKRFHEYSVFLMASALFYTFVL